MTDLVELRTEIERASLRQGGDLLDQWSRGSLVMAWNARVSENLRIGSTAAVALRVETPSRVDARDLSLLSGKLADAVASIGREITDPTRVIGRISQADFDRAPVYVVTTPRGVVAHAQRGGLFVNGQTTASTSEMALQRLGNLMPAPDDASVTSLLSARPAALRAIRAMAEVAEKVGDLEFHLLGEVPVDARLTREQAEDVRDLLADRSETVTKVHVTGVLDGVRCRRRIFYLQPESGPEYTGLVDEAIMPAVHQLLDSPVNAVLESVVRRDREGRPGRPSHRLIALHPVEGALFDQ